MLIQQIVRELQALPEEKLAEIYDLIHHYRLELNRESARPRTPGVLEGTLGESFFEPLLEEELRRWE